MGRAMVAALRQVIDDVGDAGGGLQPLATSVGSELGLAVLPLLALVGSLIAAVCVGSLVVAWLRRPDRGVSLAVTDPETAGLLPVGFVSGAAAGRWLPATVLMLAANGVLAIEDRRGIRGGDAGGASPADAASAADAADADARAGAGARPALATAAEAKHIRLVYDGEYPLPMFRADAEAGDRSDGTLLAMLAPGLAGGSLTLRPGASVEVDRVVKDNGPLVTVTREGFRDAADWYREPRPVARLRAATVGGIAGVALGLFALSFGDDATNSIAWSAVLIGAVSLLLRVFLPRFLPLNDAGLQLRERANELREVVAGTEVTTAAMGQKLLPWAVLFDEASVLRRYAEESAASDAPPAWYRSTAPFSADRLVSCLSIMSAQLSQPIAVGGGTLRRTEDSRFGVPMIGDTRWAWGGAYFAGDGGGWGAGFGGGDGGAFGGDGGFDGGGGGGFGGFDGGGGGDGGGGN